MNLKITKMFQRQARTSALKHEPALFKEGKLNRHIWRDGYTDGYIRGYLEALASTIPTTLEEVEAEEKRQQKHPIVTSFNIPDKKGNRKIDVMIEHSDEGDVDNP